MTEESDGPITLSSPGASPVATPDGTIEETTTGTDTLSAVRSAKTDEEKAHAAFVSLEAGEEPRSINRAINDLPTPDASKEEADEGGGSKDDPKEAAEGAEDTKPEDKKADKAKESKDDAQKREKLIIAKRILQRDNLSDADFEALGENRILELAEKREEVHKGIDRRFAQNPKEEEAGEGDPNPEANADTDTTETVELIREFDDDLASKVEAVVGKMGTENAQLKRELALTKLQGVIDKATGEFPELKEQAELDVVLDKASQLAKGGAYENAHDAFSDACEIVFGGRREQQAQERLLTDSRKQRDGQVDTDTVVDTETKPMTSDEKDSLRFKLLSQGLTPKQVIDKLSKIPDA